VAGFVVAGCAVATVDADATEYADGYVVVRDGRVAAVGGGEVPRRWLPADQVDGRGCLLTPGLVNTHDHLYQWATRGWAQSSTLFEWLTELYPVWARIDEDVVHVAARAGLVALAASGCTTTSDHHYVFPRGGGDLLGAEVAAAGEVGLRLHASRGSMDLGVSAGGLPPDSIVEDRAEILAATEEAIERFHDPADEATVRVAVAPCSPFSATEQLMRDAARLARDAGVRLHTHLAETTDEVTFCRDRFGCDPVTYADRLGWLGPDVWLAHGVHLEPAAVDRLAATGTGVAHCPTSNARLGSGIAPVRGLLAAGAPVGLGVDGAASNEHGSLAGEMHQALLLARLRDGPAALTPRDALTVATVGGARCLGRSGELGAIEVGKLADLALWRVDGPGHGDIADPVAALVLGPAAPLVWSWVSGRPVVRDGRPLGVSPEEASAALAAAARRLRSAVGD
jgi:cytosine/adenosine deaminase-related metal-dependent hydrolase